MFSRRTLLVAGIVIAALLGSLQASSAAEWKSFTEADFAAAKKDGKSILIDIFAPWCPTCRRRTRS